MSQLTATSNQSCSYFLLQPEIWCKQKIVAIKTVSALSSIWDTVNKVVPFCIALILYIPAWCLSLLTKCIFRIESPKAFNAETFKTNYLAASRFQKKQMRKEIYAQTERAIQHGCYLSPSNRTINIDPSTIRYMQNNTRVYQQPPLNANRPYSYTEIVVGNKDTIVFAEELMREGLNPAILNLANPTYFGGGYREGCGAQEESLARRSALIQSLDPNQNQHLRSQLPGGQYQIPEFGGIYSKNVPVFREPLNDGFRFKESINPISMISAWGYDCRFENTTPDHLSIYQNNTLEKLKAILRIAKREGHDSIVLGALGAGAFSWPSDQQRAQWVNQTKAASYNGYTSAQIVAPLFRIALSDPEFAGAFRKVAFGIIDYQGSIITPFSYHLHQQNVPRMRA